MRYLLPTRRSCHECQTGGPSYHAYLRRDGGGVDRRIEAYHGRHVEVMTSMKRVSRKRRQAAVVRWVVDAQYVYWVVDEPCGAAEQTEKVNQWMFSGRMRRLSEGMQKENEEVMMGGG